MADAPRAARLVEAWVLHHRTNQPQGWIAEQFGRQHSAANASQQVRHVDASHVPEFTKHKTRLQWRRFVKNC